MEENRYPQELLELDINARIQYFDNYMVAHPVLTKAFNELQRTIARPLGTNLVFVFGPTGAGKTTLKEGIEKKIIEDMLPILESDRGIIPIVCVNAVPPDSGVFNWKNFYKRMLIALHDPFDRPSSSDLRLAVEKALKNRKPKAVIIDEAQHLAKVSSGRKLLDQMDSIKSLADMTNTLHILFGTYELLSFRNLSGQLSRRSLDIHLNRYREDIANELSYFRNVLWAFQRHLPLRKEPKLIENWNYCYEYSIGCIGILKLWLLRTLELVLEQGKEEMDIKDLKSTALSISKCNTILSEAIEGEKIMAEDNNQKVSLFGVDGQPEKDTHGNTTTILKKNNKRPLVGQRKPKRDAVGGLCGDSSAAE